MVEPCGRGKANSNPSKGRASTSESTSSAMAGREVSYVLQIQGMNSTHEAEGSHSSVYGSTPDQVQQLLSLIETPKSRLQKFSGKKVWLFDSDASYHMTGDIEFLNSATDVDPIFIDLAYESVIYAVKRGSIELNPKLISHDVLAPSLDCNLIFIAQLLYAISY